MQPKFIKNLDRSDDRALFVLAVIGIIVGIFWWANATLVYDDVLLTTKDSSPFGFQFLVDRDGWLRTLVRFFGLDLPDQYRTYGLSRTFQFLLWSIGIFSASSYAILISLFHLISTLFLYALLVALKKDKNFALALSMLWAVSPFIWTSAFHHYSYLTLPTQLLIVGSYLLLTVPEAKQKRLIAIVLGVALGLTGEMHFLAVPLVLVGLAVASKQRPVLSASLWAVSSMVLATSAHYLMWKTFEANPSLRPRFALSLLHDLDYWTFRISAAAKAVYFSFSIPLSEMAGQDVVWLAVTAFFLSLATFAAFLWVSRGVNKPLINLPARTGLRFAGFLMAVACAYFLIFMVVVVLTDSIPHTMPRRYGYVPLTIALLAICSAVSATVSRRVYQIALMSLVVGIVSAISIRHQGVLIPAIRASDDKLSEAIKAGLKNNPEKGILFFNASDKEFPRTTIYPDSLGPNMQRNEGTEYTQATYGTYWPSSMQATMFLKAAFACDVSKILDNGKIKMVCPYGAIAAYTEREKAIVVANLGFDEIDPFGKNVRVFGSVAEFEPYFFARKIVRGTDSHTLPNADSFAVGIDEISSDGVLSNSLINKNFSAPLPPVSKKWLQNYGWTSDEANVADRIQNAPADLNPAAHLQYAFTLLKSDVDIYLDFQATPQQKAGTSLFEVQVSWNEGPWVSLGELDAVQINGGKSFSIRLTHFDTRSFAFKVSRVPSANDRPLIRSVRVVRRDST